ncbi:MAG: CPBP family intramembrane metalloprotease [Anaerolineae bacterium]|nr:CPBP family intramembrane metalloprotease [Anaerolineae bacterium]
MNKSIRNITIFSLVAVGGGYVGILLDRLSPPQDPMQGLGALVWLVSPLLANLLLRWLGGDGWKDFGLGLKLKRGWLWYLAALLIAPVVTLLVVGVGAAFGALSLPGFSVGWLASFLPLLAAGFGSVAIKNIFEEFAWRGYLTPRLEAVGAHPFLNALITGLVWAAWHIPYYLHFLERTTLEAHTSLNLGVFILLSLALMPLQALAYGELRLASGSVWTVWLLHNIANAISLPLFAGGFVVVNRDLVGTLLSPGTEGVLYSILMALVGWSIYRRRISLKTGKVSS